MSQHKTKDERDLVYDESRKRVRFELNLIMARAVEAALQEMTDEFNHAVNDGGLSAFRPTREDALRYIKQAAVVQLGIGDGTAKS